MKKKIMAMLLCFIVAAGVMFDIGGNTAFAEQSGSQETQIKRNMEGQWRRNSVGWWYQYTDGTYPYQEWVEIDGTTYYFTSSGYLAIGWTLIENEYYYFDLNGNKVISQWIGNYYVKSDGRMAVSEWVDGNRYYVDANGVYVTGWLYLDGWYYLAQGGAKQAEKR